MALYSKVEPVSVKYGFDEKEHDDEGRCITAEYEKFYLVTSCKYRMVNILII